MFVKDLEIKSTYIKFNSLFLRFYSWNQKQKTTQQLKQQKTKYPKHNPHPLIPPKKKPNKTKTTTTTITKNKTNHKKQPQTNKKPSNNRTKKKYKRGKKPSLSCNRFCHLYIPQVANWVFDNIHVWQFTEVKLEYIRSDSSSSLFYKCFMIQCLHFLFLQKSFLTKGCFCCNLLSFVSKFSYKN